MTHKIKVNNVEIELTAEMIKEIKALPDEPEFEYQLFMKNIIDKVIVKFSSLQEFEVVWSTFGDIGRKSIHIYKHTDTSVWQPVPYDKERCLWHGQPVEVWNDIDTNGRIQVFYDAKSNRPFTTNGKKTTYKWDNIVAIPPEEYKPWMFEAYKTLEGI